MNPWLIRRSAPFWIRDTPHRGRERLCRRAGGAPAFAGAGGGDRAAIRRAIPPTAPAQADAPTTEPPSAPRSFMGRTSISSGIDFAVAQFARSKWQVERRIIDISGDGTNNSGRSVTEARDQAVSTGLTINGWRSTGWRSSTTAPIWDIPSTATRPVDWRIIIDRT